jgi:molybdenum cofactor synthesis domain-containing protein
VLRTAVITVSDRGSRGEREDLSGPEIVRLLEKVDARVVYTVVIPDETDRITATLIECTDAMKCDLILTTGGTGVSPRDVTPDATRLVIEKEIPGMAEAMRREGAAKTPHAMLSRAIVGIRKQALIVNLPGSPKGARENLAIILPAHRHAIEKIQGDASDCATDVNHPPS